MMRSGLILGLLAAFSVAYGQIQFAENGYSNVVVTVSPDVPKENAQSVVDGIKVQLENENSVRKTRLNEFFLSRRRLGFLTEAPGSTSLRRTLPTLSTSAF